MDHPDLTELPRYSETLCSACRVEEGAAPSWVHEDRCLNAQGKKLRPDVSGISANSRRSRVIATLRSAGCAIYEDSVVAAVAALTEATSS